MALDFNSEGYLYRDVNLTFREFMQFFGTNFRRMLQIENSIPFFRMFHRSGCNTVYVDGSFVSTKKNPEDIDLCFDLTLVDIDILNKEFPQFFDVNAMGSIRRDLYCHIFHCTEEYTELFEMLRHDREGNRKGFVKLNISEILTSYDKK